MATVMSIREYRVIFLSTLFALAFTSNSWGQTARVQFINASPYPEADLVDVYRNGTLWLESFRGPDATPYEDWPVGDIEIAIVSAGQGLSAAFFLKSVAISPDKTYLIAAAGDPLNRPEQHPFDLFIYDEALERSPIPSFPVTLALHASPDAPPVEIWWRNRRQHLKFFKHRAFGEFNEGYQITPTLAFDIDARIAGGRKGAAPYPLDIFAEALQALYDDGKGTIVYSDVMDNSEPCLRPVSHAPGCPNEPAIVNVNHGFLFPPSPEHDAYRTLSIFADGAIRMSKPLLSAVQWINNIPYRELDAVDIYLNGTRVIDDLNFREASRYLELPVGLTEEAAPEIRIQVVSAHDPDSESPIFERTTKLLFGSHYVAVLAGDPLGRQGEPPLDLFISDQGRVIAADSGSTDLLLFNGTPDVVAINIGIEGDPLPLSSALGFGSFWAASNLPPVDDTLYAMDAARRQTLGLFERRLASDGLADSALVILTSGFAHETDYAQRDAEFDLVTALPSGGPLSILQKNEPTPWWQQPLAILAGLVGLALVVLVILQIRVRRLQARAEELSNLVDERTRELRLEKEKTEEQARRLSELDEVKNRFFANISHEFRTPLTLILGPVQDALDGKLGGLSSDIRKQQTLIRRNARRLLRLVNQLLDLSKMDSGKMEIDLEPGDLIAFLGELVRAFMPLAERRRVSLTMAPTVASIPGQFDFDHLEKIFANLISNALKFTPQDGRVTIEASLVSDASQNWTKITVVDTGSGIPNEQLERIFDRFQQGDSSTRRAHEGSGVGLTLARELAELHGGTLTAQSQVGKGSKFEVRLPVQKVDSDQQIQPAPVLTAMFEEPLIGRYPDGDGIESQPDPGDVPLVLIVEDNDDVREYLRSNLSTRYRVVEAVNGEAGFAAAAEHHPDLILCDVMMPVMDGFEMLRRVRATEELHHTPVVMLTAKASERDTLEGLETGADDYIAKPFSVDELVARVSNFITSRRELREKYSRVVIVKPGDIEITPDDELFLDSLLEIVNVHLTDSNFSVDWLADELSMGRRQVERKTNEVTGQSPADLIRGLRLERASQLLRAGAGTVSEIAHSVGFRSVSAFSTAFHRAYGETPTQHAAAESV